MELNKCIGCMEDFLGYPCPKCGFDPGQVRGNEYALPIQTILAGKYLVGRVLGQGGFGITYIGWDIALERKIAIKEYYPNGQANRAPGTQPLSWYTSDSALQARQAGLEMFLKEARKMARVEDIPGVVKVKDLFRENNTAYIVMDFVEGETLKTRLQRTGPMSWDQAKDIFRPAIQAMAAVHQAGLIHRDLSPDNLMLTKNGNVKILDLGAAKDLNINSGASSMQVAKGGFSPFEQYTQRGGSGPWTDVYAMAATVYYTLTGTLPPAAMDRVEEDTIRWDLPGLDTLPEPALEALKAALAVSAKKRTQSMEELEQGLFAAKPEAAPKSVPEPTPKSVPDVKPGAGPRTESKVPKKTGKVFVAVAVVAVMAVGGVLSGVNAKRTAKPAPTDSTEQMQEVSRENVQRARTVMGTQQAVSVAAGYKYTVGLRSDGTVVTAGSTSYGKCNVEDWTDIVAIAAGENHTVGLHSDGTVVAVGLNGNGQCDVDDWTDIVAVAAGTDHTVGLRSNGTVVAVGSNASGQCDVDDWADIVAIAAGAWHTVGLRGDGTVVAAGFDEDVCDVGNWTDIVAVAAGPFHTVGLRCDGTVVAVGINNSERCNVNDWTDIVAISAVRDYTVGLRSDGTVVAAGYEYNKRYSRAGWTDIIAISGRWDHIVGLRGDGTVVATGGNDKGQCDVSSWTNIRTP